MTWPGILLTVFVGCTVDPKRDDDAVTSWDGDFAVGAHPVGFRTASLTRTTPEGERRLTLSVWYPADEDSNTQALSVADYFQVVLEEGQLEETEGLSQEAGFVAAMTGAADALSTDLARHGLDSPVLAHANATPSAGRYPVVLWSSRHATVLAQAPLAEVLASQGFVVATVWSSDPPLAFLWEERSPEEKLATIEAQTQDLEGALEVLRQEPTVDGDNVVVLAWSYGGQTAARLQERDPGVRGVVAMDANVVPARDEESLNLVHPLVYLVGRDTSGRGFERLEGLGAPWIAVRFTDLAHGNFNALEGYLPGVLETETVFPWSSGGTLAREGYRGLVRVVTAATRQLAHEPQSTMSQMMTLLHEAAVGVQVEVFTSDDSRD